MLIVNRNAQGAALGLDHMDNRSAVTSAKASNTAFRRDAAPRTTAAAELTILTVGIEKHYEYIRRQIEMIDALNPGAAYSFIAVDNAFGASPGLALDDPRCTVLAGVDPSTLPEEGRGSYHHAAALNKALPQVKTRYALILDPDLYVVYRNWIGDCLDHMKRRNLGFFGVPWHSRWYMKWRGFPCVHFMLIDLAKAPAAGLDFTPKLVEDHRSDEGPLSAWMKTHAPVLHTRLQLGARRDTGWSLQRRFGRGPGVDLALPVVDLDNELTKPRHLQSDRGRWLERRVPPRWRFLPSSGDYVDPSDAPGLQGTALRSLEPERFVWRGAPFAFHLRGVVREEVWGRSKQGAEHQALPMILDRIMQSPTWLEWNL